MMAIVKALKYFFLLLGLGLFGGGIYDVARTHYSKANWTATTGTVVHLNRKTIRTGTSGDEYRPVVRFTDTNGNIRRFDGDRTQISWLYKIDEKLSVWYDPKDPAGAIHGGFFALWFWPGIAIIIGGLVLLVWTVINLLDFVLSVWLRITGVRVQSRFVGTKQNLLSYIYGLHPYNVVSRGSDPLTGKSYEFTSSDVWKDLSQYTYSGPITVYFRRNDPKLHYMDLSFLSVDGLPEIKEAKPPASEKPSAEIAGGATLGDSLRSNWGFLVLAPLFWPFVLIFSLPYDLPMSLTGIAFLVSLGIAVVPIVLGRASFAFFVLATLLWMAGFAISFPFAK